MNINERMNGPTPDWAKRLRKWSIIIGCIAAFSTTIMSVADLSPIIMQIPVGLMAVSQFLTLYAQSQTIPETPADNNNKQ